MSPEEKSTRNDLAACYHLLDHYGWTDLSQTHISARIPNSNNEFLINPYGLFFNEVNSSNLVKVNLEGQILGESDFKVNRAGFVIDSAVFEARPDVNCIIHTHTVAGVAVSCLKCGLLPLKGTYQISSGKPYLSNSSSEKKTRQ